jgi:hypothetical protein
LADNFAESARIEIEKKGPALTKPGLFLFEYFVFRERLAVKYFQIFTDKLFVMNEFKATNDKHRGMNEFKSIEKDRGEGVTLPVCPKRATWLSPSAEASPAGRSSG